MESESRLCKRVWWRSISSPAWALLPDAELFCFSCAVMHQQRLLLKGSKTPVDTGHYKGSQPSAVFPVHNYNLPTPSPMSLLPPSSLHGYWSCHILLRDFSQLWFIQAWKQLQIVAELSPNYFILIPHFLVFPWHFIRIRIHPLLAYSVKNAWTFLRVTSVGVTNSRISQGYHLTWFCCSCSYFLLQ